jgi:oxygen-independent coproporphyrinogen-3 oxidase
MNPDDVTVEYAAVLQQLPINRVSMGAQTFDDHRLQFLRRRHTATQVRQAVTMLRTAGITNISIDLMYGFPDETMADWESDIDAALSLDVEHISAYCLTIEENTPLWRLKMKDEKLKMPGEELERAMYERLIDRLTAAGYEHYEISNFAKPGYQSRHNSSYWQDIPYIGLGAAAHSYDGHCRSWNVSDIHAYIAAIGRGELPSEKEVLDDVTHYNDRITTALRTRDGLDLSTLPDRFHHYCLQEAQSFLRNGLLRLEDNRLTLTRQGLFVCDMVMSALMKV